jgi:dipeptidyl aminopeptidase/acylaminoacyl peptidase
VLLLRRLLLLAALSAPGVACVSAGQEQARRGASEVDAVRIEAIEAAYHGCAMRRFGVSADGRFAYAFYQAARSREVRTTVVDVASGREEGGDFQAAAVSSKPLDVVRGQWSRQFGPSGIVLQGQRGSVAVYDLAQRKITRTYPDFRIDGSAAPSDVANYRSGWYVVPVYWGTSAFQRLKLETGEVDVIRQEWPRPVDWRLGANGVIVTRTVRDGTSGPKLFETAERNGAWRTVLRYDAKRSLRAVVPIDYSIASPPTELWVMNNFDDTTRWGRLRLSDGRLTYPRVPPGKMERFSLTVEDDLAWATYRTPDGSYAHYFVDAEQRALFEALAPHPQATVEVTAYSGDGNILTASIEDENDARRVAVYERRGRSAREVKQLCREPLGKVTLSRPRIVEAPDGFRTHAYEYAPASASSVDILYLHGGPRGISSRRYNALFQVLVDEGYRILSLDYRGSGDYGASYLEAGRGAYDAGMVADVLAAARWMKGEGCLRRSGAGCASKLLVVGDSLGAYLAQAAVIREPALFAGFVSISGLSDLSSTKDAPNRFIKRDDSEFKRLFDLDAEGAPERLKRASPISSIELIAVPGLYAHAKDDQTIPFSQAAAMVEGLRARGRRAELVVFERGGHELNCDRCRARLAVALSDFVRSFEGE